MPKPLCRWRLMRLLSEGYTAIYNGLEFGFASYKFIVIKFNEPGRKMGCYHLSYIKGKENQMFICTTIHLLYLDTRISMVEFATMFILLSYTSSI